MQAQLKGKESQENFECSEAVQAGTSNDGQGEEGTVQDTEALQTGELNDSESMIPKQREVVQADKSEGCHKPSKQSLIPEQRDAIVTGTSKDDQGKQEVVDVNKAIQAGKSKECDKANISCTVEKVNTPSFGSYVGNLRGWEKYPWGEMTPCVKYYICHRGLLYESLEQANSMKREQLREKWKASLHFIIHISFLCKHEPYFPL